MLKRCQNVPHTIFMQISAAITGKCIFRHISAQSADISTYEVSNPMLWWYKTIFEVIIMCLTHDNVQNSAAITEKSMFRHRSVNNKDNCT